MTSHDLSDSTLPELLAAARALATAGPVDTSPLDAGPLLFDLGDHDLVEITGRDRVRLLHAMLSNAVQGLPAGQGCWATLNTVQGRVISDARLLVLDDGARNGSMLALLEPGGARALVDGLDRYIIADKVFFEDVEGTSLWLVAGSGADEAVAATGAELPEAGLLNHVPTEIAGRPVRVVRLDRASPAGELGLLFADADAEVVLGAFSHLERGSHALLEAARIEAGLPRFGLDITRETIPLEAGLKDRAIDFDKGCYVGQEVICRIDSMGSPKRRLCRLAVTGEVAPEPGTALFAGGKRAGFVTSAVVSARLGHPVALGYVRKRNNAPGSELNLGDPEGAVARVVDRVGD